MKNKPALFKYFDDRKWTVTDFEQTEWNKCPNYNTYFLGKQKNKYGACINCNGVMIFADYGGRVYIGTYDNIGDITKPYILITKDVFVRK